MYDCFDSSVMILYSFTQKYVSFQRLKTAGKFCCWKQVRNPSSVETYRKMIQALNSMEFDVVSWCLSR